MIVLRQNQLTEVVAQVMERTADPRLRQIMVSLVRHLHGFVRDDAAAGGMVVGGRSSRPMDVVIRWVGAALFKNGAIEEFGVSTAIMGHPAAEIAWLVNKLAPLDARLEAGQIVLAGSSTWPVSVAAGDVVHADHGPLGAIGVSFV